MRGRLLLLTVLLVVAALLAALNWDVMRAPVRLELLVGTVETAVGWVVLVMTVVPAAVLLIAGLLDQARALRRVDALERQLEQARDALERARSAEIEALEGSLDARLEALRSALDGAVLGSEARVVERFEMVEATLGERVADLYERVVLVRDELAADIAEAEDALLRRQAGGAAHEPSPDDA